MNFTLRRLSADDPASADQLRAELGWNQTIRDWKRLPALSPEGFFAAEQCARVVGTCTTVSYGKGLAWIGMMMVHPASRGQGIGHALLQLAVDELRQRGARCIKLDATPIILDPWQPDPGRVNCWLAACSPGRVADPSFGTSPT